MDINLIKILLSRFNKFSFKLFTQDFFSKTGDTLRVIEEIKSSDIYYHPLLDSYGDSLHAVYIFNYTPIEVLNKSISINIRSQELISQLHKLHDHYKGEYGYWGMVSPHLKKAKRLQSVAFLTNFANYSHNDYENILFPQYGSMLREAKIKATPFVGSFDSYVDKNHPKLIEVFEDFMYRNIDGLSINLNLDDFSVNHFTQEKSLVTGVLNPKQILYEPVYVSRVGYFKDVLSEFTSLLKNNASENKIEKFITYHYRTLFGFHYDRIETQLWLHCPEVDIRNKSRRLDIFLRNSLEKDWELFEIKRANIKLTKTYRDVPAFSSQITSAIQQLKNYKKILSDKSVKEQFARSGIEYFEPSLRLVVGRKPEIDNKEWRWLKLQMNKT